MANGRKTEIFFIVDGARLEAQACLLAPSLKQHLAAHQRTVAYVREDYRAALDPLTLDILMASDVELRDIPGTNGGHAPWAAPYPHGNKILAAACPRDCDISVFLDTDTILAAPVDFEAELGEAHIAACVSDYAASVGSDADWAAFYETFGLEPTTDRVRYNGGRRIVSYPYFNAGVVVFRERTDDGHPTQIGSDWLAAAIYFEREVQRDYARSNIDQFTLPILGYLRGAPVKALSQHMNFNIQGFGDADAIRQKIVHYHRLGVLWAHRTHGRQALERLVELHGTDAPEAFLDAFGAHAKRKRMKHHIEALRQTMVASGLAATAPRTAANP
ncbi:hypothetical protein [Gymnodinialimonas ulvae]|uniref:hypothetical protein n=1 Tax=Gymnodinialimonas ulvae TaxID=3126504 RepID=UPI0030B0ADE4